MQHFSDFYEQRRSNVQQQIAVNPSLDLASGRVGDLVSKAVRELNTTPSVKQGFHRICSALIYAFSAMMAVKQEARHHIPQVSPAIEVPTLLWLRMGLATVMLLIGLLAAGSMVVDVTCQVTAVPGQTPAQTQPAPSSGETTKLPETCTQKVEVSQRGPLAQALVWSGLVLLTLEALVLLRRTMRRSVLSRWMAPPRWLDPYALSAPSAHSDTKFESVVAASELDHALTQAFAELDASMRFFAEPDAVEMRVPNDIVAFLQRTASLAVQSDTQRLIREMKNIPALLSIHDLELVAYAPDEAECFDQVVENTLRAPQTTRFAIRKKSNKSVVVRGEAFVPQS